MQIIACRYERLAVFAKRLALRTEALTIPEDADVITAVD
jgi:hypothetical protein